LTGNSARITRSLLRGMRANIKIAEFLTGKSTLQLAAWIGILAFRPKSDSVALYKIVTRFYLW
jgi:hypothetical protein